MVKLSIGQFSTLSTGFSTGKTQKSPAILGMAGDFPVDSIFVDKLEQNAILFT